MAYTTVSNIEDKRGSALSTEQADYFTNVISGAVDAYIEKQTGTMFGSQDSTSVYVSGEGGSMLVIPTMHDITAVATIDDDDSTDNVPDYVKFPRGEEDTYALRSTGGSWSEGFENYQITGKLGYKSVPDDIVQVATELAINALGENDSPYKSEKVGDWQVVYNDADKNISDESRTVLASYRRLSRSI